MSAERRERGHNAGRGMSANGERQHATSLHRGRLPCALLHRGSLVAGIPIPFLRAPKAKTSKDLKAPSASPCDEEGREGLARNGRASDVLRLNLRKAPQKHGDDVEIVVQKHQEGDRDDEWGLHATALEVTNEVPPEEGSQTWQNLRGSKIAALALLRQFRVPNVEFIDRLNGVSITSGA